MPADPRANAATAMPPGNAVPPVTVVPSVAVPPVTVVSLSTTKLPAGPVPQRAAVVDRDLLDQLRRATRWWSAQRTWRVSSSHTGGGVIGALEAAVAAEVAHGAYALALPSGTAAMLAALTAVGVCRGDRVGVPAVDSTASAAVLHALGATPVPLPVDPLTGMLDPSATRLSATELSGTDPSVTDPAVCDAVCPSTARLAAVIAVHLHGLTCDVPGIRHAIPGVPIVEDAARAWAARYPDGNPVGSGADACAFSFGSAKMPGAGELGCLVTRDLAVYRAAVRHTQHPTRQLLEGIREPCLDQVMTRVAPAAALLGGYVLHEHARTIPGLREAAACATATLRAAGMPVLTDPPLHVPGTVTVHAAPSAVRAVLAAAGVEFATVDGTDVTVYPDYPRRLARSFLDGELSVVTCSPIL
jgi:hypothetical protein